MPDKPKSTAIQTVGTRKGNGAGKGGTKGEGWGGSPQGDGSKGAPGVGRLSKELQALHDGAKEVRLSALKANLLHLAFHAEREETQLSATNAALDREMGKPVSRNEMTGADGAALHPGIQVTFVRPTDAG